MSASYGVNLRLLAAFRHLMIPLVRILVKNGIPLRDFVEVLKRIYVRLATEECEAPDRPATLARVALLTGMNRREVDGVLNEEDSLKGAFDSNAEAIASLMQGWHSDPEFLGPYGFPRPLSFQRELTGATGFVDLVAKYGRGVAPAILCQALVEAGTVTRGRENGVLSVEKRTFIPDDMGPEQVEVFARGVRRYVDTINFNLEEADPEKRRLERWVFPDYGLREEDWDAFTNLVKERLQGVIDDLDRKFADFPRPDLEQGAALTVGVGMYIYNDTSDDDRLFERRRQQLIRSASTNR